MRFPERPQGVLPFLRRRSPPWLSLPGSVDHHTSSVIGRTICAWLAALAVASYSASFRTLKLPVPARAPTSLSRLVRTLSDQLTTQACPGWAVLTVTTLTSQLSALSQAQRHNMKSTGIPKRFLSRKDKHGHRRDKSSEGGHKVRIPNRQLAHTSTLTLLNAL